MKPMTKEEWDARQSVIRKVVDPETGRTRWGCCVQPACLVHLGVVTQVGVPCTAGPRSEAGSCDPGRGLSGGVGCGCSCSKKAKYGIKLSLVM